MIYLYVYNSNSAVSFILNNFTFSQYTTTTTLLTNYIYVISVPCGKCTCGNSSVTLVCQDGVPP